VRYDKLILATGGRVRRLDIPGAHYLRTIEDAIGLRISLLAGGNVLVVGGGWIGLEAAAAARLLGCDVTVERPPTACAAVSCPPSCRIISKTCTSGMAFRGEEESLLEGIETRV